MKTFRLFGPTIGKGRLSRRFINVINTQIGNSGIGVEDGKALNIATSTTLYNENEVYVAFVNELLGGGAVSPIAVSVSVEIVEQIHDYNTNITTNI